MGSTNINSKDRKLLLLMKKKYIELLNDPKEKFWHPSYKKSLKSVNDRLKGN